ncbi:hypothetical protein E4Q23_19285 [Candidatus Accumulibacter phosphatis]|jgi:hypothetical protein|uniref:Uncharacterized protein n=1 Tax=Candidatus Accumulibacter phosphatis TaxID=327160 RepID=A0ABX1U2N7_9PROT|nr:hypothetical protein [Candidatus Accumulibacter phosphatis]NMQ29723.1 hypothetical protein [Candidatus Accumulibacter phosphatis]
MALTVFETAACAEQLAKSLQLLTETEQLNLESVGVSVYSPGPICDAEPLFRAVDQPVHFQNGEIVPTAFDDSKIRGMSVNRRLHISVDDALQLATSRVAMVNQRKAQEVPASGSQPTAHKRRVVAYTIFKTSDIRALVHGHEPDSGRRAFGVYDTATEGDNSHGDVFFLLPGKQAWRSVRSRLYDLAKNGLVILENRA